MNKKTKQGVRDLNHLKGVSPGRKLELPECVEVNCKHKSTRPCDDGFTTICNACGQAWDYDGRPLT